jgi:high-affinity nickel permease
LKDNLAGAVSVYDPRGLADLGSREAKPADMERNVEGQYFKYRKRKDLADWIISMFLIYPIGWCIGLGLNQRGYIRFSRLMCFGRAYQRRVYCVNLLI